MRLKVVTKNVISAALLLEAASAALSLAALLPSLDVRGPLTWLMALARAVVTGVQLIAASRVRAGESQTIQRMEWVMGASAGLRIMETGFRLVPTNLDPTFRWPVLIGYVMYAAAMVAGLRSVRREARPGER